MFWVNVAVWLALTGASFMAWRKYNDTFLLWSFWVGIALLGATVWQHLNEIVIKAPEAIQMGSLIAVQMLRLVLIIMLVVAGIRVFKSK